MKAILTVLLGLGLVAAAVPAHAETTSQDVAYGAGSAVSTLVYVPLKTSFCVVGAVTGALTIPFGGPRTAERVATTACGGSWIITPDVLRGRERLRFLGEPAAVQASARP